MRKTAPPGRSGPIPGHHDLDSSVGPSNRSQDTSQCVGWVRQRNQRDRKGGPACVRVPWRWSQRAKPAGSNRQQATDDSVSVEPGAGTFGWSGGYFSLRASLKSCLSLPLPRPIRRSAGASGGANRSRRAFKFGRALDRIGRGAVAERLAGHRASLHLAPIRILAYLSTPTCRRGSAGKGASGTGAPWGPSQSL